MNEELPRLFTVQEVSKYLTLSKSQVYSLIEKKELPCIRLTERRIAVSETDLLDWLQRRKANELSQLVSTLNRILDD